ncbi:MAG: hypothetical protein Q9P01_02790 [Anaerolineae bacterium]|nr:hypothetical protein [Anaerolineae bacterium]MDQ7033782.1 hypothetical protein [Anaerolineae bacterium]
MTDHSSTTGEIDIIEPQAARAAIDAAILEHLGDNWQDDWLMVHDTNFLVRLNNGDRNMDFQADLLGDVEVTEKAANPIQISGRYVAWWILGVSIFLALTIAVSLRIIG